MFLKMNRAKITRSWERGGSREKKKNLNISLTKKPNSFRNNLGGGAGGVKILFIPKVESPQHLDKVRVRL